MSSRRLHGSRRPVKPRKRVIRPRPTSPNYEVFPVSQAKAIRKPYRMPTVVPSLRKGVVMALPFKQRMAQHHDLPIAQGNYAVHALQSTSTVGNRNLPNGAAYDPSMESMEPWDHSTYPEMNEIIRSPQKISSSKPKPVASDRHRRRRESQYTRWQCQVIPSLVRPLMEYQCTTQSGHTPIAVTSMIWGSGSCSCIRPKRLLRVILADWNSLAEREIMYCACTPAAPTLVSHGFFPCAPIQPSLAFSVHLLDFVHITMANTAPNVSGWSLSLEQFWNARGYRLGMRDRLRRRFANAYQWYGVLLDEMSAHVNLSIPDTVVPRLDMQGPPTSMSAEPPGHGSEVDAATAHDLVPVPEAGAAGTYAPDVGANGMHPYLREACPACFGPAKPRLDKSGAHVLVCLDANFTQKCLKGKYEDPPLKHPRTHFLPEADVAAAEELVNGARGGQPTKKPGILPEEVLEECEHSFTAAAEKAVKASSMLCADTGLMALVCRHDRVLWVVNLTTPGERQYYAFALIQQLFKHLPVEWHVGLLYDIACQLERSMLKHGILEEYYPRLQFAVSVFHAYGHQWPCQLKYHPRKRAGFGMTDGEGCERFWSGLKRLIPSLRVSGSNRRRWVLDRQIAHIKEDSIRLLGLWNHRKRTATDKHLQQASNALAQLGIPDALLRSEWESQIRSQTAKLQRKTHTAADQAIERVLELHRQREELQTSLWSTRKLLRDVEPNSEMQFSLEEDMQRVQLEIQTVTQKVTSSEKLLGVGGRKRLETLKGNEYLRLRMHAQSLKSRIRAKIVSQKFERTHLERAYRHHATRERDHTQVKALLKRGQQSVTSLVSRFNRLIDQMQDLKQRGKVPGRARVPKKLLAKMMFRLDVDDEIWQDDGLLADEGVEPPAWLSHQPTRDGIVALLQRSRAEEELERLEVEETAMKEWVRERFMALRQAYDAIQDDEPIKYQVSLRMSKLWDISEHWRRHLDPEGTQENVWVSSSGVASSTWADMDAMDARGDGASIASEPRSEASTQVSLVSEDVVAELAGLCMDMLSKEVDDHVTISTSGSSDDGDMNCEITGGRGETGAAGSKALGKQCGPWHCYAQDIAAVRARRGWFEGSVITVLAEALSNHDSLAHHTTSLVLYSLRRILDHPEDARTNEWELKWVQQRVADLQALPPRDFWLIPAHVPAHWTLVALQWSKKHMYFHDSLNERLGAREDEERVREEAMELLRIADPANHQDWKWISEQRPTRQFNGHDCAAFVLADMAEYMASGRPSNKTQADMGDWRRELVEILDKLPDLVYEKMQNGGPGSEDDVLVIED